MFHSYVKLLEGTLYGTPKIEMPRTVRNHRPVGESTTVGEWTHDMSIFGAYPIPSGKRLHNNMENHHLVRAFSHEQMVIFHIFM